MRLRPRRVPVQLQMSQAECGAACLAMVLSYHGRPTPVSECRTACAAGRDGLTAETLMRVARTYGLRVRGYSVEPPAFGRVRLPAILHWGFNHFVVLERWSARGAEIVDPAAGRRRVTPEELDRSFTGVVLVFQPGPTFERSSRGASPRWQYLARILRVPGTRCHVAQILAVSALLQALGLGLPLVMGIVIDRVLPVGLVQALDIIALGMGVLVITQLIATYLRGLLLASLQQLVDAQLMVHFFEHLLRLPFRFFAERSSGDLLMRLSSNSTLRELLAGETLSVALDGLLAVGYVFVLLSRDLLTGGLTLGLGVVQGALLLGTARSVHELTQRHVQAQAASQSYLLEALRGIATLKACGAEERVAAHWSGLLTRELNIALRRGQWAAIVGAGMAALRILAPLLLLWIGANRVLAGNQSLGTMLGVNALAAATLAPVASLVSAGQQMLLAGALLERMRDVLDADPEQADGVRADAPRLSGRIELRRVSFRYDANSAWVLRDISLSIAPGQKVALVGATGSGKSTLGLLLLGLYQPTEGAILYDGQPLQAVRYASVRRQFGAVLQESVLFADTIHRNITLADPALPWAQCAEAARLACIKDEIERMPMAWQTMLADGGSGLSGGQVQRIALARALAHRPAILLLDEATSHLDVATERQVDLNLSLLDCTRIVIAHRLSTISNADHILVLDEGRIVERGTHAELLANEGPYAALVRHQLQLAPPTRRAASDAAPPGAWVLRWSGRPEG